MMLLWRWHRTMAHFDVGDGDIDVDGDDGDGDVLRRWRILMLTMVTLKSTGMITMMMLL